MRLLRAAGVLAAVSGLGFGLPGIYGVRYFAEHGQVWTFLGYPTYGHGPFEDAGIPTSVPLLVAFVVVCAAEVVAGWLLWRQRRAGVRLALWLLPVEFAFWIGFALPFGPVLAVPRTALIGLAWARGRRAR